MYLKDESLYVSGLVNMASFNTGPSYVDAICMTKDNYKDAFSKFYKIKKETILLEKSFQSLESLLKVLFNLEKKPIDTLMHWLTRECGECINIYTSENEELLLSLSGESKGLGPFFFLEEIYFIEFEKMIVCFMIGNDE